MNIHGASAVHGVQIYEGNKKHQDDGQRGHPPFNSQAPPTRPRGT